MKLKHYVLDVLLVSGRITPCYSDYDIKGFDS